MSMPKCSKQLSNMVQRGEQLRACWVIPFPQKNYFYGGTRAGERGLVCGKSFCAFTHPTSLGWQEECWVQEQRSSAEETLQTTAHLQAPLAAYENPNLN